MERRDDLPPAESHVLAPLRNDWELFGITPEIRELIPGGAAGFLTWYEDSLLVQTAAGYCGLWIYRGHEAGLAFQCQLLQIAAQNSFKGFLHLIPWRDERTYRRLDERNWLYLTQGPALRKMHFHDFQDIRELVRLIIDFRKLTHHCGLYYGRTDQGGIGRKLTAAVQQLQIFAMLAEHRLRSTGFDRIYLGCYPGIRDQAVCALERLAASAYRELTAQTTICDRALYDLARHNLAIAPEGHAVLIRPDACRREVPVVDLAFCLVRTGRSNGWSPAWYRMVLTEYQEIFPVDPAEASVLVAILGFPWSIYRLCSRYFFNQVDWPVPRLVEKLERLMAAEVARQHFLNEFEAFLMDECILRKGSSLACKSS